MNVKQNGNSVIIENNGSTITVDGSDVKNLIALLYENEPVLELNGENLPESFTQPYKVSNDCELIRKETWYDTDYVLKVFLNKKLDVVFTVWKYCENPKFFTRSYGKIKTIQYIDVKRDRLEVTR